jgi:hypothetical protein
MCCGFAAGRRVALLPSAAVRLLPPCCTATALKASRFPKKKGVAQQKLHLPFFIRSWG